MIRNRATATTATVLGIIASGGFVKLMSDVTTKVAFGMEDVLDDDWGAPTDGSSLDPAGTVLVAA